MTQKILAHAYFFFRRKLVELESTLRVPIALSFSTHLRISKVYSESTGRKPQKFSHVLSFFNFTFFHVFQIRTEKALLRLSFFRSGNDGRKSLLSSGKRFNQNFVFFMLMYDEFLYNQTGINIGSKNIRERKSLFQLQCNNVYIVYISIIYNYIFYFQKSFPISKENLRKIATNAPSTPNGLLYLLGMLQSKEFLLLHRKTETKAKVGDGLKVLVDGKELQEIWRKSSIKDSLDPLWIYCLLVSAKMAADLKLITNINPYSIKLSTIKVRN